MNAALPAATPQRGSRLKSPLVDLVAILALLALTAVAFWPVYGTSWLFVTVLGFGGVGIGVAWLAAARRLTPGSTALVAVVAWFVFGAPLAMPSATFAAVLPTPRALWGLLTGPVTAWRDMLSLAPPIGESFNLLTVPGLVAMLAGWAAMHLGRRSRPALAWLPLVAAYLVAVLVGAHQVVQPVLVGVAFFVIVLLWSSYRRQVLRAEFTGAARVRPLRLVTGLAVVLVGAVAVGVLMPALAGRADRSGLRASVEPPVDLLRYSSPLQGFRANITKHRSETLFEASGAHLGDVIRIATLDQYDGVSFSVSALAQEAQDATTFTRVGQWIADDGPGQERSFGVLVRGYRGVWVPTLGRTTSISFEGDSGVRLGEGFYYNRASGTGFVASWLGEGDAYHATAKVTARPSVEQIAAAQAGSYELPPANGVSEEVKLLAAEWTQGTETAGAAALQLEQQLRTGYFSHGQQGEAKSLPGHTERRIKTLLSDPARMIGDHEQYAVAMALMARQLGIPARVIYGYQVQAGGNVTGDHVGAWPELYLAGLGWVLFDPTPPKDRVFDQDIPPQPPQPQPYIENPPPPLQRPDVPPPDEQLPIDPGEPPREEPRINWGRVGALFALTGIPLLTVVVPIVVILALKARRRHLRRHHPNYANRVAGAWAEVVDKARDVGRSPSPAATRSEQAADLLERFPAMANHTDVIRLAKQADVLVFAPQQPDEQTAADYWDRSATVHTALRRSIGRVRWLISSVSTRSLRKIR